MYEHRRERLLPIGQFLLRFARHIGISSALVLLSLFIGMLGYVHYEHLSWLDGFLNAAMLLGGMGPVEQPQTSGGKLFAGLYALYSGLVFLVVAGIMLAPVGHRVLHRFHLEDESADAESAKVARARDATERGDDRTTRCLALVMVAGQTVNAEEHRRWMFSAESGAAAMHQASFDGVFLGIRLHRLLGSGLVRVDTAGMFGTADESFAVLEAGLELRLCSAPCKAAPTSVEAPESSTSRSSAAGPSA